MRGRAAVGAAVLGLMLTAGGCAHHKGGKLAASEPALDGALVEGEPIVADAGTGTGGSRPAWVDRHPILYKPGDFYQNTNAGPITKGATAVVIGVPAGVIGEVKQVFVGQPKAGY